MKLKSLTKFVSGFLVLSIPLCALAKRAAPPEVKPIITRGIDYSVVIQRLIDGCNKMSKGDCAERMFVIAKEKGVEKWKTEVLHKDFDPKLEIDVQEVYPLELKFQGQHEILIKIEDGTSFVLDRKTGRVRSA